MSPRLLLVKTRGEIRPEKLEEQMEHSEQEARMVLPGIQALFGFQLVAAFNSSFKTQLSQGLQNTHLIALLCVAVSVMFVLTPAAYHRQAEAGQISRFLVKMTGLFLTIAMVPMMLGIVLDVYVIAYLITSRIDIALITSILLLVGFISFWFIFPWVARRKYKLRSIKLDYIKD